MLPGAITRAATQCEDDTKWRQNNKMFQEYTLGFYYKDGVHYYKITLKATDQQATLIGLKYKILSVDKI
jgi:hypothetical protein